MVEMIETFKGVSGILVIVQERSYVINKHKTRETSTYYLWGLGKHFL